MREILGEHFNKISHEIFRYLHDNIRLFEDPSILEDINPENVVLTNEDNHSYSKIIIPRLKFTQSYDSNLRWLTRILVGLYDDDFKAVVCFSDRINTKKLSSKLTKHIELLKRLANLFWKDSVDILVPKLRSLMEILPPDSSSSKILRKYYQIQFKNVLVFEELDKMITEINRCRPSDPECLYFLGNLYYELEDYEMAIKSYEVSLRICKTRNNPLNAEIVWFCELLAKCYLYKNNYLKSVEFSSFALRIFKKYHFEEDKSRFYRDVYFTRCKAYFNQHDYELALQDINDALQYSDDAPLLVMKHDILNHL